MSFALLLPGFSCLFPRLPPSLPSLCNPDNSAHRRRPATRRWFNLAFTGSGHYYNQQYGTSYVFPYLREMDYSRSNVYGGWSGENQFFRLAALAKPKLDFCSKRGCVLGICAQERNRDRGRTTINYGHPNR